MLLSEHLLNNGQAAVLEVKLPYEPYVRSGLVAVCNNFLQRREGCTSLFLSEHLLIIVYKYSGASRGLDFLIGVAL